MRASLNKKWASICVLLTAGATLATACGSDDDKKPSDGGGGGSGASLPSDAAPASDQVIKLRLNGEPKSIDPQQANFDVEISRDDHGCATGARLVS